jgi:hypothetical protein
METKYNKWTVLDTFIMTTVRPNGKKRSETFAWCQCECGKHQAVNLHGIKTGKSTQCKACKATKHGCHNTPEYGVWEGMKERCNNPKRKGYANYGARGIGLCERWNKFENFLADMGKRPSPELTIERVDNDKGYGPDNCVWDTRSQQNHNRRPYTRRWMKRPAGVSPYSRPSDTE